METYSYNYRCYICDQYISSDEMVNSNEIIYEYDAQSKTQRMCHADCYLFGLLNQLQGEINETTI